MQTEWVVDRKKVPKNWKPTYDRIKAKIDAARNELPKDNTEIEEFVKDRPGKQIQFFLLLSCRSDVESLIAALYISAYIQVNLY